MIERNAKWIAWSVAILSVVLAAVSAVFHYLNHGPQFIYWASAIGNSVPFTIVGALILSRLPRNRIGWIFCATSVWAFEVLIGSYSAYVMAGPTVSSIGIWLAWLSSWFWLLGALASILAPMLFPTGKLLSPAWRPILVTTLIGVLLAAIAIAVYPGEPPYFHIGIRFENPVGLAGAESFLNILIGTGTIFLVGSMLVVVLSLLLRFRRSQGLERQQLKWFVFGGAINLLILPITGFVGDTTGGLLAAITSSLMPTAAGIAILRYRLYDIDIIIRCTLVYGVVTAVLALSFNITEIVVQQLVSGMTGQSSQVAIIVSTLAVAALFNPLRHRVQEAVDHRFYRRKYDAQKVLERFAQTVRDEVELEKLTGELLNVVNETMQPTRVSLWLKKTESRER
jgi:hypothetical protein